ncbi:hypothetical protein QOT17_012439 [Balamuthia mandrillaris]
MEMEAVGGGEGGAPSLQLGSYALQLMRHERRSKVLEPAFQQNDDDNRENYSEEIFSSAPSLLHFIQTAAVASGSGKTKQSAVLITQQLSRLFHYALVQQDQSISSSLLPQEQTPLEVLLAAIQHHRQNHCFVRPLFVESLFRDAAASSQIPAQALWLLHKAQVLPFHHFLGMLLPHWTSNHNHQEKGLPDVARLVSELQEGLLLVAMPSSASSSNNRRKQLAIEELLKLAIRIATYDAAAISTITTTSATSSTTVAASATTSTAAATTGSGRTVLYSAEEVFSASHLLAAIADEATQHRAHKRRVCLLRLAKDIPAHHITQSFFVQQLNSLILVPSLDASSLDFASDTAPVSIEEAFISFETTKAQTKSTKEHSTIVFQELVSFFSLNFLLSRVSQLVEDPTIANWPQAITYLQVLRSSSTQASQVLLSFFREELTSSITSMNSYKCRVLILLFRTLAPPHTEERSPTTSFMSYFAWLRDTITNVSRSRKSSVFLMNLLNDLFDLENAYYLRLHLQLVPRLRKASTLAEEYVNKSKTKLSTMGESTQQSSFQASSLFYQQQSSEKVEQEVQSLIAKFGLEALPSSSLASDFMVYTQQQQGDKSNQTSPNNAGYVNLISYLHQVSLLKPRWFQQVLLPHLVSPPAFPLSQLSTGRQHLLLALLQASSSDFHQQQQRTTSNKTSVRGRGKSPTLSIGGRSGGTHQNQGGGLLLSPTLRSKLVDYLLACQRLLPQQTAPSPSLLHEASASASARSPPQLIILEED